MRDDLVIKFTLRMRLGIRYLIRVRANSNTSIFSYFSLSRLLGEMTPLEVQQTAY